MARLKRLNFPHRRDLKQLSAYVLTKHVSRAYSLVCRRHGETGWERQDLQLITGALRASNVYVYAMHDCMLLCVPVEVYVYTACVECALMSAYISVCGIVCILSARGSVCVLHVSTFLCVPVGACVYCEHVSMYACGSAWGYASI